MEEENNTIEIETNEEVETTENTQNEKQVNATYSRSEVDREVSKAVETALSNYKKGEKERIEKERQEAERLAKLTEKEREKEQLTKREKDLDKRAQELERKELLSDAESTLREKQLPASFANVLLGEDAEKTLENINGFKTAFDEAVNNAVKEKLRQETPPAGGGALNSKAPSVADLAKENRIIK